VDIAKLYFDSSVHSTAHLKDSVLNVVTFALDVLLTSIQSTRQSYAEIRSCHFTALWMI